MNLRYFFILLLIYSTSTLALEDNPETKTIDENYLFELVKNGEPPALLQLNNNYEDAKSQLMQFHDQFSYNLKSAGSYARSKEEPFISFQPIFSPDTSFNVSLQKNYLSGVSINGSINSSKREYSLMGVESKGSIASLVLSANVDLWKNLFGRISKAQKDSIELNLRTMKLQKNVQTQVYLNQLRTLYWQLIANRESLEISNKLLKTAKLQEAQAKKRYKNSVADKGEVARYSAQVATRTSQVTSLLFEKQQSIQVLRKIAPELTYTKIDLGNKTLTQSVSEVLQCVGMIKSKQETPFQYSLYDDLNKIIADVKNKQVKIAESYNSPDIFFQAKANSTAVDESLSNAYDETISEDRQGLQVGFQVNIPLGLDETKKQMVRVEKMRSDLKIKENNAIINSQHEFIKKSITYLLSAIKSQRSSKESLEIRLKEIQKKYRQGRISVTEFIFDQDNLLQVELQIVQTKFLVVKTLLDYLNIFTLTPCAFNRIVL